LDNDFGSGRKCLALHKKKEAGHYSGLLQQHFKIKLGCTACNCKELTRFLVPSMSPVVVTWGQFEITPLFLQKIHLGAQLRRQVFVRIHNLHLDLQRALGSFGFGRDFGDGAIVGLSGYASGLTRHFWVSETSADAGVNNLFHSIPIRFRL
jgi:hypothetical protein